MNNEIPFVSTPFSNESALMPINRRSFNASEDALPTADIMENEYPEIYYEIYPLVVKATDSIVNNGSMPTTERISFLVDVIIKNSGLWYEDDDDDVENNMEEAIPVQFGFGRNQYRRRRRKHHNRNTLRDITRILLIRELFDKMGHGSYHGNFY